MNKRSEKISTLQTCGVVTVCSTINSIMINWLEVVKTRIMNDSLNCESKHYQAKGFFRHFRSQSARIHPLPGCNNCLPSRNMAETCLHLAYKEGPMFLFRGVASNTAQLVLRS